MRSLYLGQIPVAEALNAQDLCSTAPDVVLGFEPQSSVITLGLRAQRSVDVLETLPPEIAILDVDRGGQATLHNPGQLVIFPVLKMGMWGVQSWVDKLSRATQNWGRELGCELYWDAEAPGLYDRDGAKVVSLGVRVRSGVSTHGLSINVGNSLNEFAWIRSCGRASARLAHLPSRLPLATLFERWCFHLKAEVDNTSNLTEFGAPDSALSARL